MPGLRHRVVGSHEKFVRVGGAVEPRPDRAGVRARREDASEPAQARHQASTEEGKFSSEEKEKKKKHFPRSFEKKMAVGRQTCDYSYTEMGGGGRDRIDRRTRSYRYNLWFRPRRDPDSEIRA